MQPDRLRPRPASEPSPPDAARAREPSRDGGRLLCVCPVPLWPDTNGYALRVVSLLSELAADWEVVLVGARSPATEDRTDTLRLAAFHPVGTRGNVATMPWQLETAGLAETARALARSGSFDAALLWSGAEFLGDSLSVSTTVGDRIDCATLAHLRDVRAGRGLRARWVSLRAAARAAPYERRIVRRLSATTVVATPDARLLRRISGRDSVHVVPNGVEARFEPGLDREDEAPRIVFTGALGFRPNAEAATYFARRVFPLVRDAFPKARFTVAGWGRNPDVLALGDLPGVDVVSDVPDLAEVLTPAWVAVAPMLSGSGIKNKVLDAWACGKPVVMTSLAGDGFGAASRDSAVIADGRRGLARAVIRLLERPEDRLRTAWAGYRQVTGAYSWKQAGRDLSELIEAHVAGAASAPAAAS